MNGSKITIAAVQMSCEISTASNIDRATELIESAATAGADIVCLQELFSMQYPCQTEDHRNFDLAETVPDGDTCTRISKLAKRHRVVIVGSFFERRTAGIYHNTSVIFDEDGHPAGKYRKMHIPDDPCYYEKFYFTPGDLGFQSIQTSRGHIGVCVCWDQWFPEAARITALKGAEIIVYPTAIGWLLDEKEEFGTSQHSAWETMMRSHAIANGVFVVAPNRVGIEGKIEFWGASFICDPNGQILARASHQQEEIITAECDETTIDVVRTHWPFLRDRRIDAYSEIDQRFLTD